MTTHQRRRRSTATRRTVALTSAVAVTITLTACGGGGGEKNALGLEQEGTIVVAMSGEFQPFSYFEGNTLTGFDHDIAAAVADELGVELEAQTGAFDTLIQGLKADRYDVLIASMTPTEERDEQVDFTDGYYISGAQAFVAAGTTCTDVSALDAPVIGVASGTTYQDWLADNGGDWVGEVRTFSSDVTALQDVATGRLDAAMTDRNVGLHQIQSSGLDLVECGDPVFTEEPAFAVDEGNEALRDALDEALATIKADGTYAEISEKYFGKDISVLDGGSTDDAATTTD